MNLTDLEHATLELWAKKFGFTATLGFICTLLLAGKFFHYIFQSRGLVFGYLIVPPAIISGLLGLLSTTVLNIFDDKLNNDLITALESVKSNLTNFLFASLILGLTCSRKKSQHLTVRGIITSIFHEGMPMLIYYQILIWGQSASCILMYIILTNIGYSFPTILSGLIPIGLESGNDIVTALEYSNDWTNTILNESEALGLITTCLIITIFISGKPFFISRGFLGQNSRDTMSSLQQGSGQAEAFERLNKSPNRIAVISSISTNKLNDDNNKNETEKSMNTVSLGAHISLIALTVFVSFAISFICRLFELEYHINQHLFSGIRMFKLSMCCGQVFIYIILSKTRVKFKREWFMRLCGLMLDILVISGLTRSFTKPIGQEIQTNYQIAIIFIITCLIWNFFCFLSISKKLFPNYWYERGLILTADALGHSFCGLLVCRTLDPAMESPVLSAYAYKLMIFFIPSSGGKNAIVLSTVTKHGPYFTLLICICVMATWWIIFESYFKHRFILSNNSSKYGSKEDLISHSYISSINMNNNNNISRVIDKDELIEHTLSFDIDHDNDDIGLFLNDSDQSVRNADKNTKPPISNSRPLSAPGLTHNRTNSNSSIGFRKSINNFNNDSSRDSSNNGLTSLLQKVTSNEKSSIITSDQMDILASMLPLQHRYRLWNLKYSLRRDGASLDTLLALSITHDQFNNVSQYIPTIILIEDSWGYIFGGFLSHSLDNKHIYYGDGESFVFTIAPNVQLFHWSGKNNLFVLSNSNCLAMGGGGEGFAFQLDDELDTGVSNKSDTYDNNQLSSSEFFKTLNVEVWMLSNDSLVVL